MKNFFPEFYRDEIDYKDVWAGALFVFDTNVLLNMYRYRSTTREQLLAVLSLLQKRIWIPHHVALEFQRNRIVVIAEQNKRYSETREIVEKSYSNLVNEFGKLQIQKRHSLIDPTDLLRNFEKLKNDFQAELENLKKEQIKIDGPDNLLEKIDLLFFGNIGAAPENLKSIEDLYKVADARYKQKIPPGFKDFDKDKDESDEYLHSGIIYKRKFGDFLIWRQILEYTKANEIKSIILITDDMKEDWWEIIKSEGNKVNGPRKELINEAKILGGIESFLMYNPEGLLKYAKQYMNIDVSDETIKEVREISSVGASPQSNPKKDELKVVNSFPSENQVIFSSQLTEAFIKFNNPIDRNTVPYIGSFYTRRNTFVQWNVNGWIQFSENDTKLIWHPSQDFINNDEFHNPNADNVDYHHFEIHIGRGPIECAVKDIYGNAIIHQVIPVYLAR